MARTAKAIDNIQVFRGSLPRADVFAQSNGDGCCTPASDPSVDRLGARVRFDNALAHSNPTGANDKFRVPGGNGFSGVSQDIIAHINANGVGAEVSVLCIPTYCFVTGAGVFIAAEETGLTFNLKTRNGLALPAVQTHVVTEDTGANCTVTRVDTAGAAVGVFAGFGALAGHDAIHIFGRDGAGRFSLEADEFILEVATMPAGGVISGTFDITVSVSYDVIHRAEF